MDYCCFQALFKHVNLPTFRKLDRSQPLLQFPQSSHPCSESSSDINAQRRWHLIYCPQFAHPSSFLFITMSQLARQRGRKRQYDVICFASNPNPQPKKPRRYDPEKREKVALVRRAGACLRCRLLKLSVGLASEWLLVIAVHTPAYRNGIRYRSKPR
jgi:hypothetical protein